MFIKAVIRTLSNESSRLTGPGRLHMICLQGRWCKLERQYVLEFHIYPNLISRFLRCGVLKEVLRLLFFINDALLNIKNERMEVKDSMITSELSHLTASTLGVVEKAPFSSGTFIFILQGQISSSSRTLVLEQLYINVFQ